MTTADLPAGEKNREVEPVVYQQPTPAAPDHVETTYPPGRSPSRATGPLASRSVADLLADVSDPHAWNEIVDRYAGLVWAVARGFRFDEATAADVTQQTWLTLVEQRHAIRDPERLGGWLATTTRRIAIRTLHRRDRERPSEQVEVALDARSAMADIAQELEDEETRVDVRRAFAALPESCRTLLQLCLVEPKIEYVVIANLVGRPVGSLGPTRRRCLDRLRNSLGDSLGDTSTAAPSEES